MKGVTSCLEGMGILSCLSSTESKLACRRNHREETIEDGEAGKVIKDQCSVVWMAKDIAFPKVSRRLWKHRYLKCDLNLLMISLCEAPPHPLPLCPTSSLQVPLLLFCVLIYLLVVICIIS